MKHIKIIFFLLALIFTFSSCQKCMECENDYYISTYTQIGYDQWGFPVYDYDSIKAPNSEICRDDFDSKDEFQDYIDYIEEENGSDCKSDFWN